MAENSKKKLEKWLEQYDFPIKGVNLNIVDELPELSTEIAVDYFTRVGENSFYFNVPEVAHFYSTGGSQILIQLYNEASPELLKLYLNGSVLGSILYQRSIIPLHASNVLLNNQLLTVCGDSGMGKSSTCYGLVKKGGFFVSDDLTPICIENNDVRTYSLLNYLKLDENVITNYGQDIYANLERVPRSKGKVYFHPENVIDYKPKIEFIFILTSSEANSVCCELIEGVEAFELVFSNLYRREYLVAMKEISSEVFQIVSKLIQQAKVYQVSRPNELNDYDQIIDVILEQLEHNA